MHLSFLTLFPEAILPILKSSLIGKAQEKGLVHCHVYQVRDFAADKHRTVDEPPFGGGEGMVMRVDVLHRAWLHAKAAVSDAKRTNTILMSPQGRVLSREVSIELGEVDHLIIVCGHYEGIDERFSELCVDEEVSIGDYVLTGGELPALVVADAVIRRIPGVLGNTASLHEDCFEAGLLKYPQYTRPRDYQGLSVPEVLLSGNHARVDAWREEQSLERTRQRRPDLLSKLSK
jgi:tRNA (guanine37-N1)-methyltransferase